MKICPQCSTAYKDEILFCLSDGTKLIEQPNLPENAPEIYEDSDTIIRNEPIVIDFGQPKNESEPIMIDFSDVETVVHPPGQVEDLPQVTIIEKPVEPKGNYALFLVIGLFVGGGLVLLTLFLAKNFFDGDAANTNANAAIERAAAPNSAVNSPAQTIENAAAKHEKPNPSAAAAALNGSVIAVNAYVRALPDRDAAQIDVLPIGDRLKIERRENDGSPWYQVTCEHGTTGWMHGNTIAFN